MAGDSWISAIFDFLRKLFGIGKTSGGGNVPTGTGTPPVEEVPAVMNRKVMVINFLPPAAVAKGWFDPDVLITQYIAKMKELSNDMLVYEVVSQQEVAAYPLLEGNRRYDDATWARALVDPAQRFYRPNTNPPQLAIINYPRLIQDYQLLPLVQSGTVDEVWLFGGPYFGFQESLMAGRGAFPCNGPFIEADSPRFVIMGFSYEREMKLMVHDYGHRMESILSRKFNTLYVTNFYAPKLPDDAPMPPAGQFPTPQNAFEQFLLDHGTVHRQPGGANYSQDEYVWLSAVPREWWPATIDPNRV
jgi:hypothetical protein